MKSRSRRVARFLAPCSTLLTFFASGCARPVPEAVSDPVAVVVAPQPAPDPTPQPDTTPAPTERTSPAAPTSQFPEDLAGKELARVGAPGSAAALPVERFGHVPKPRPVPAKVLDPDVPPRVGFTPRPVSGPPVPAVKPVAPPETVPIFGAAAVPVKPVLPVAAAATEIARDVNLPPPAPVLGRQVTDRVSLDDPTSEVGNAQVVAGTVRVSLGASEFVKVAIPDPFELAEHMKPKVPAAAEPSAVPVPVNPQRVK
ncbi:hypothetical protein [Frigoriglobus tundricola]|uniref:Uncharacterized protein n=1 Tax=Frigoriglobus tundricola TaxID=2774151 RepID=A0A6M5YRQ2_9BACT|nr:hypothetical protein [Frigoriglobus tundricola]QJW95941.1 hypothetical protein FTUN_3495 [Frigoriglobus tundricola]